MVAQNQMMKWRVVLVVVFLFSVIVVYLDYFYTFYLEPNVLSVRIGGNRFFMWYKDEPIRVI